MPHWPSRPPSELTNGGIAKWLTDIVILGLSTLSYDNLCFQGVQGGLRATVLVAGGRVLRSIQEVTRPYACGQSADGRPSRSKSDHSLRASNRHDKSLSYRMQSVGLSQTTGARFIELYQTFELVQPARPGRMRFPIFVACLLTASWTRTAI